MRDLSETVCVDGGIGVIQEVYHISCHVFCRVSSYVGCVSSYVGQEHRFTAREEEKVINQLVVSPVLDQGN